MALDIGIYKNMSRRWGMVGLSLRDVLVCLFFCVLVGIGMYMAWLDARKDNYN